MTTFDKREEAFEKKFALDEELKFKAEARRNRLLGLWAAEKLGITGEAAATYAREAVRACLPKAATKRSSPALPATFQPGASQKTQSARA